MTLRDERITANEIMFREVNERIDELAERTTMVAMLDYVCECGQPECTGKIPMSAPEYEAVRTDGQRFVTLPGHQTTTLERVVESNDRYRIVEKSDDEAAQHAEATDPAPTRAPSPPYRRGRFSRSGGTEPLFGPRRPAGAS